jgi:sugar O-acyltransferase (sialic acid O-acetyltransferase NeuD family)
MILSSNSKRVDLIGAGGHARAVIALLERCEYGIEGVYDKSFVQGNEEFIAGIKLRGAQPSGDRMLVVAIGDNSAREAVVDTYSTMILPVNLVDPSAIVNKDVVLGNSNQLLARTILNTEAKIGNNNIINTGAIIEHETEVGSNCHISVNAVLCGRVKVGDNCFVGAGAVVIDGISICSHVIIGAGAVVIRNITEPGVYVGNPARRIK